MKPEVVRMRTDEGEVFLVVLSSRERDVAGMVMTGSQRDRDDARELGISLGSFRTYKRRLYDKLGVNNEVQLVNRVNSMPEEIRETILG